MTTQQLKLIFKGRLEFGSKRSYDMAMARWVSRLETYYKSDILFKLEQVFVEEEFALVLPQQTIMSQEKPWRSTTNMLQEIAQFAMVGSIGAWCVDSGQLLEWFNIEPISDKSAVVSYLQGRELIDQRDRYEEATAALSRAIDKYERHALAYERRGYVNYKLKNFNDALHDFDKSIAINPNNPEPHYGRGKVRMLKNEWETAANDFDQTIKRAIALQPIYWLARLKRGECLFHAKKFAEAIKEFRLFLQRNFAAGDPNLLRRRRALMLLGKALLEVNEPKEALQIIDQVLATETGAEWAPDNEAFLQRARAKRATGVAEYAADLETAAKLGSPEAARLLEEWQ